MAELSLHNHMERSHRIVLPHTGGGVDIVGGVTETYVVDFPQVLKLMACPVYG